MGWVRSFARHWNNRSITYMEEEIDYLILVPNSLIHGREVHFLQHLRKKKVKLWRNGISISNDVKKAYEKDANMSIYWPLEKTDILNQLYIEKGNIIRVSQLRMGKKWVCYLPWISCHCGPRGSRVTLPSCFCGSQIFLVDFSWVQSISLWVLVGPK